MLSLILLTSIPFEPFVLPKDIYKISLCYLKQSLDSVSLLAYKKTANQIKPVATTLPEDLRIIQCIPTNPLETLPEIPFNPLNFSSGECYTLKCKSAMNVNKKGFLWPEEKKLVCYLIKLQEFAFAWTKDEKGNFLSDYFDLVVISTIEHILWSLKNIPILLGIFSCVVEIIKEKLAIGIYEPSNSSYWSHWFCYEY